MSKTVLKLAAAAFVASFSMSAVAGGFNVWTYSDDKAGSQVVVSFSGDGVTQDAQLDMSVAKGVVAASSKVLVPGSVCAISPAGDKIRAVPPSGAGSPLTSKETDYCSFVLKPAKGFARMGGAGAELLKVELNECAGAGASSCGGVEVMELSERGSSSRAPRTIER